MRKMKLTEARLVRLVESATRKVLKEMVSNGGNPLNYSYALEQYMNETGNYDENLLNGVRSEFGDRELNVDYNLDRRMFVESFWIDEEPSDLCPRSCRGNCIDMIEDFFEWFNNWNEAWEAINDRASDGRDY